MVLVRPLVMILPGAEATMSILPNAAQPSARQNRAMIVTPIARPVGEGGDSTISSAAGRNAISSRSRRARAGNGTTLADFVDSDFVDSDFMDPTLPAVEGGIAAPGSDQLVMRPILDQAAALNGHDAVAGAHRREAVRDDEDRATLGDLAHVLLDDALALVIERARSLVEDEDARIGYTGTRNGDALALSPGERSAPLAHHRVVALGQLQDKVVRARERGGGDHALHGNGRINERDIVAHRPVEQHVLLHHHPDLAPQPRDIDHREIDAVHQHPPALRDIEALNELGERALA